MLIVGCDLHTRYQWFAMLNREIGELTGRRLEHENGEARAFYAALPCQVRMGVEVRRRVASRRWYRPQIVTGEKSTPPRCR